MPLPAATSILTGEVTGTTVAVQLPNIPCGYVKIKAQGGNSGKVYLGTSKAATIADGVTDVTTGFELTAGQETDWLPIDNLNKLWLVSTLTGHITYLVIR